MGSYVGNGVSRIRGLQDPWRWDRQVVPKLWWSPANPRCVTSQKSKYLIYTASHALVEKYGKLFRQSSPNPNTSFYRPSAETYFPFETHGVIQRNIAWCEFRWKVVNSDTQQFLLTALHLSYWNRRMECTQWQVYRAGTSISYIQFWYYWRPKTVSTVILNNGVTATIT